MIIDWVAHHAVMRPDEVALHGLDEGETRTWAELEARVGRLAGGLTKGLGLKPGDRVASLTDGNIRVLELQFACMRAGLVFMPLNFRLTVIELTEMCERLFPSLMVTDENWSSLAGEVVEQASIATMIDWIGDNSRFEEMACGAVSMPPRTDMRADDPALILFTSGSTGAPKAATSTSGALMWQALNLAEASAVAERGAHVFTPLPLFHNGGLNSLTNPILFFGGKVTVSARFDPVVAARFLGTVSNGVTHVALVPMMYELISACPEFDQGDFSSMRSAIIAGGRLPVQLYETWSKKGVCFSPQYGGTETGPTVTALNPRRADKALAGSCGTKVMFVDIRLVDAEGMDVKVGEAGEVWLKGPAITPGYVGRDRDLDFTDDWFRTGDVARRDEDGFYYIVDRLKDMYKSGGENVSAAEVEQVLAEHRAIKDVAVIGVRDSKWGEVGLAVIVLRNGQNVTLEDLHSLCEGRLAKYKRPNYLEVLDILPRNVTGKIAKDELRRRFNGTSVA